MSISPHIFRAYDIRGKYPDELHEEAAYAISRAYCTLYPRARTIVVSRDFRLSSPSLKKALILGILDSGRRVIDIGPGPVPVFYFAIIRSKADGGLMVTGSHNPPNENGIKLQKKNALPLTDKEIEEIKVTVNSKLKTQISKPQLKVKNSENLAKKNFTDEYIKFLSKKIIVKRPLRVVVDMGNGACGKIPAIVFRKLGCKVKALFAKPDGRFPHHIPDPHLPESLISIQKTVRKWKADLGLAYDGDGDRVGLVDSNGRIVNMDFVLMLLGRCLLETYGKTEKKAQKPFLVLDVRVSQAVIEDMEAHGGIPSMVRAGRSFVLSETLKQNALFGGELTGHLFFPKHYLPYDDGIFAGCMIARCVSSLLMPLSQFVDMLPRYASSPEIFVQESDEKKFQKIERLVTLLKKRGYRVLDIDGARIHFDSGWALARASNTGPFIKLRLEGKTKKDLSEISRILARFLQEVDITPPKALRSL